jgi:hypothetical protein
LPNVNIRRVIEGVWIETKPTHDRVGLHLADLDLFFLLTAGVADGSGGGFGCIALLLPLRVEQPIKGAIPKKGVKARA